MSDANDRDIRQWARIHQYLLDPMALRQLSEFLRGAAGAEERQRLLHDVAQRLRQVGLKNRTVDVDRITSAISVHSNKVLGGRGTEFAHPCLAVVPLSQVPCVTLNEYSDELRVTRKVTEGHRNHTGRNEALRCRYLMARRRCWRSGIYRRDGKSSVLGTEGVLLLSSAGLEGISPSIEIAVLGILVVREGEYFLEDLRGCIPVHINSDTGRNEHNFIGEGFIVIVTGFWSGTGLLARRIELPPAERREVTLKDAGPSTDLFGLAPAQGDLTTAVEAEKKASQSVVIFLAHIHLDKSSTFEKLKTFFTIMEGRGELELAETTFVLIGNFCSNSLCFGDASHLSDGDDSESLRKLRSLFEKFTLCMSSCAPTACLHSDFIFIPGPNDITSLNGVLPQPPFSSTLVGDIQKRLKRTTFAPNPCRLRFLTQEIVVSRRDYMRCFQQCERRCWGAEQIGTRRGRGDEEGKDIPEFERVAKTVLDQAHLCPDLLDGGVLWKMESALSLPGAPQLLLLCDTVEQWESVYKDVHVLNPGSFCVSGVFLWYTPADRECSISRLD